MSDKASKSDSAQDQIDYSVAWQYFGSSVEVHRAALEPVFGYVQLAANERLIRQGDKGDTLYIVLAGRLRVVDEESGEADQFLAFKEPGDGVGEIALLTGERRTASVFAEDKTQLLSLSRQALDAISERAPEVGLAVTAALKRQVHQSRLNHVLILTSIFKDLSKEILQDVQTELELITVASGEVLIRHGDVPDALYIIIGGRLRIVSKASEGEQAYTVDSRRGQTVGEIGLITGAKRTATVFAVRDSLLAKLSKDSFRKLLQKYPETLLSLFAAPIITRLRRQLDGVIVKTSAVTTITVIAVDRAVPLAQFTTKFTEALCRLGTTRKIDSEQCALQLGTPNVAYLADDDPRNERFVFWLNEQEATYDYVVYQADYEYTSWTNRCIRQADMVLVVGLASSSPELSEIESHLLNHEQNWQKISCLILIHGQETQFPTETDRWLLNRKVRAHYHMRMGEEVDYWRIGRLVTGHGIGLVLSGGGARALAHIGVLQALQDCGVPIDAVGAVSGGAIIAGLWAMGLSHAEIVRRCRGAANRVDYTLPLHSLSSGRNWTNAMERLFGKVLIEDLWRHFFCISTNLSRAKLELHESGSLMHAIRASTAIPGILPPVFHAGEVLVDGGLINNLPTDMMRAHPDIGQVIAVDVSVADSAQKVKPFDYAVSGWKSLFNKLSPWTTDSTMPTISEILLRSISITNTQSAKVTKHIVDLYLEPPVKGFGLLDFDKIEAFVAIGYEYARQEITMWQIKKDSR